MPTLCTIKHLVKDFVAISERLCKLRILNNCAHAHTEEKFDEEKE